jgi:uncharacterized protein YkwD
VISTVQTSARKKKYAIVAGSVLVLTALGVTQANASPAHAPAKFTGVATALSTAPPTDASAGQRTAEYRGTARRPRPRPTASTPTTPAPTPTPTTPPGSVDPLAQQVLDQINEARAAAGLPAYTMEPGLVASAALHNQQMLGGCGLSHQCPGEAGLGERITAQGVRWNAAGENIGYGGPVPATDQAIVDMAKRLTSGMLAETPPDDGHRRNLLSSTFHRVEVAIIRDSAGRVWLTQDFAN